MNARERRDRIAQAICESQHGADRWRSYWDEDPSGWLKDADAVLAATGDANVTATYRLAQPPCERCAEMGGAS